MYAIRSYYAGAFDVFVNEAFSVCHRDQSSVTGVTKFLPSYAGFWLQKEVENLDRVLDNPAKPAVAIIGGAKIETKLPLIEKFEKIYDQVFRITSYNVCYTKLLRCFILRHQDTKFPLVF